MFIDKTQLRNGITQYTYWEELIDVPLGILWVKIYQGQKGKKIALLLNTFTAHYYTHKGVCTELTNALLIDADVLLCASGTQSSIGLMKKLRFKYNNDLDIWSFVKRR